MLLWLRFAQKGFHCCFLAEENVKPKTTQLQAVLNGVKTLAMTGTNDRQINSTCTGKDGLLQVHSKHEYGLKDL